MSKRLLSILGGLVLSLATVSAVLAQNTKTVTTTQTTAVQNADGTWTVVEYPVDKEVVVNLAPSTKTITTMARARVLRSANGTLITVDPAGFVGTTGNLNLYAVDPMGHVSLLGPINATSTSPLTYNTELGQFMLVVSPEGNLTTFAPNTTVAYRSAVPEGLSIIPVARSGEGPASAEGEKVAGVATPGYNVGMLNIPTLPAKKETQLKVNFDNTIHVNRTDFFITPNFNGKGLTRIKAKFHDLSDVPTTSFLTLWAVSPDGKFFRIGSTPNKGKPNVATIDSDKNNTNVPFTDFGLFLTVEPTGAAVSPTGTIIGTIIR
jgi:hypothetical protein